MSNAKLASALYYDQLRQDQAHEDAIGDQLPPGWPPGSPRPAPSAAAAAFPQLARLIETVKGLEQRLAAIDTTPPLNDKIILLERRIAVLEKDREAPQLNADKT
jgi:hypothetical protein